MSAMSSELPRLSTLPIAVRLGLTGVVLTMLVGLASALVHLRTAHERRDEEPGLSLDDLRAAYSGIHAPSRLAVALESGHPATLAASERARLVVWLKSSRVSEDFDDPDKGNSSPAEIVQKNCLACHARKSTEGNGVGQRLPLEYWADVKKLAFARELEPTPLDIVITSAHTHALSMALVSLAAILLAGMTRWSARWWGPLACVGGLALSADIASWFLARESSAFVLVIATAGGLWFLSTTIAFVLALLEMWIAQRAERAA
jgi:hypothetical protein